MIRSISIEARIKSVIASMEYEGFTITEEDVEDCKKILNGEITADEACFKIIDRYK